MGHIFISYSHKDTEYAHGLANNLQSMGFDEGNKYIFIGSFEDHDAYGNVEWYDWTAER